MKYTGNEIEQLMLLLEALPKKELTYEESIYLMNLMLMPEQNRQGMCNELRGKDWVFEAMEKRVNNLLTVKIDGLVLVFTRLCVENIAHCMLILYYIQYRAKKMNMDKITLDSFCEKIMPDGFPSSSDLNTIWVKQVRIEGNMIDIPHCAKSIL